MQKLKNKNATILVMFLMLTIAIPLFAALPTANAHTPAWTFPTWCYIAVINDIIGVNQAQVFVFWINAIPPTANGAYGDRWTFYVDVVKPDGNNETLGPFTSDPVGGSYTTYVPTQVGTYTVVAKMAELKITGLPSPSGIPFNNEKVNDTYAASTSDPVTFIVEQEPIRMWQESPLPSQYWTRPISGANRDWNVLAGNWLAGAAQVNGPTTDFAYGTAPESAHIMWTRPMWAGGIMDARFGDTSYTVSQYEGLLFTPGIILNGRLYYTVSSLPKEGYYCVDLYTGETIYFFNTTGPINAPSASSSGSITGQQIAFGQILNIYNPNQHGGFPYLWSTTGGTPVMTMGPMGPTMSYPNWMMFDAFTGNYICSIANVSSSGTAVYGKDGSILRYNIVGTGANKRLTVWNTTEAIWWRPEYGSSPPRSPTFAPSPTLSTNSYWMWRPGLNVTYDGNNGFSMNVSIPDVQGSIRAVREDLYVIGGTSGKKNGTYVQQGNLWALSLERGKEGTLLWNITFTPPENVAPDIVTGYGVMSGPTVDPEDGVFIFSESMERRWWGYSLETGQLLWGPTESEPPLNFYGMYSKIYQGRLLTYGWGGKIIAYNITTGAILWNYTAGFDFLSESPYGDSRPLIGAIADGKLYTYCAGFWATNPLWRDYIRCLNASTGAELWKILGWPGYQGGYVSDIKIGDGFLVAANGYDDQIYCFGKGPSATTAYAPTLAVTAGSSATIQGTVMDISAGTKQLTQATNFPNGVAAVSDESQEAWMEYLYMQQGMPTNATGVPVSLDAIDPNGNFVHLGTATSDTSGTFGYAWTPPDVPGKYTIIATFAGSKSYYSSYAETYAVVSGAPAEITQPEYPQPVDNTMTIVGVGIAMIIAVAIAAIWIKKK